MGIRVIYEAEEQSGERYKRMTFHSLLVAGHNEPTSVCLGQSSTCSFATAGAMQGPVFTVPVHSPVYSVFPAEFCPARKSCERVSRIPAEFVLGPVEALMRPRARIPWTHFCAKAAACALMAMRGRKNIRWDFYLPVPQADKRWSRKRHEHMRYYAAPKISHMAPATVLLPRKFI